MQPTRETFLRNLMTGYGATKQEWTNNNRTQRNCSAYVLEVAKVAQVTEIVRQIFEWNKNNRGESPIVAVPVAGWEVDESEGARLFSCCSPGSRRARIQNEYAKSFSLAPWATGLGADIIFHFPPKFQTTKLVKFAGERCLEVSAGVRITDADEFLKQKKFAMAPNNSTLHVSTLIGGMATGSYGPARDHGPMSSYVRKMTVISPTGELMTLSATENNQLFATLKDCHLGAGFIVTDITLGGIEPLYRMKRLHTLYQNVYELRDTVGAGNPFEAPHCIIHYIPCDIEQEREHTPRIRISTFERTEEPATHSPIPEDVKEYVDLEETTAVDGLIYSIVRCPELRQFFPFVLDLAAKKTFGKSKQQVAVGAPSDMLHLLKTYTDLPLADVNWIIRVDGPKGAKELAFDLLEGAENILKECGLEKEFPLLTIYCRYNKGILGAQGISPTGIEVEQQGVLAFELLTYSPLAQTPAFKRLVSYVLDTLKERELVYSYQPGKTPVDGADSLDKILITEVARARLEHFKDAIAELHGSKEHIASSPFMTPEKKAYLGFGSWENVPERDLLQTTEDFDSQEKEKAIRHIIELAKKHNRHEVLEAASQLLSSK